MTGYSLREILLRIARTAAIAVAGAAALLLVLHLLAGVPNGHLLIVFVLSAPLGALFGWVAVKALRSGELPYRFGVDRRDRSPVGFWSGVVVYAAGTAALGAMSLWILAQLVAGPGS